VGFGSYTARTQPPVTGVTGVRACNLYAKLSNGKGCYSSPPEADSAFPNLRSLIHGHADP